MDCDSLVLRLGQNVHRTVLHSDQARDKHRRLMLIQRHLEGPLTDLKVSRARFGALLMGEHKNLNWFARSN